MPHPTAVPVGKTDITLRKTMELTYHIDSDENHPGEGTLQKLADDFVMR